MGKINDMVKDVLKQRYSMDGGTNLRSLEH